MLLDAIWVIGKLLTNPAKPASVRHKVAKDVLHLN
jgi:hypothetical protein